MQRDGEKLIFNEKNVQDAAILETVNGGFAMHPEFTDEEILFRDRLAERRHMGREGTVFTIDADEAKIMVRVLENKIKVDSAIATASGMPFALQGVARASRALSEIIDFAESA